VSGASELAVTSKLVLWLGAIAGIMALLVAVIALDFGDIPLVGTFCRFIFSA